jgi:putative transposase
MSSYFASYVGMIVQTRQLHPGMGLRQIWEVTRPPIGRDAFIELGMYAGLGQRTTQKPIRTTFSVKSNRYKNLLVGQQFTSVNQLWVCDITYFQDPCGHTYYLFFLMDAYSRKILGYCAADNLRAINAINVLKMAIKSRGIDDYTHQLIHHSDRGSQYIANEYTQILDDANIKISMCLSALENAYIERVHGTIKNQYLNFRPIESLKSLQKWLAKDVYAYNYLRPHTSLKGMTPVDFENYLSTIPISQRTKITAFTNISEAKSKIDSN